MAKFRKKPVIVDAIQYTCSNIDECIAFCPELILPPLGRNIVIPTFEGNMTAKPNDWIIRGVNGECYPCKPDVFEKTYESVQEI